MLNDPGADESEIRLAAFWVGRSALEDADYETALASLRNFVDTYPGDPQVPTTHLLLARASSRRMDDIVELYRDDDLLIVSKPAGMPVHGGAGVMLPTLIDRLREDVLAGFGLVHRLDQDTTGAGFARGGIFDRFDSILFAAPAVFAYLNLVGH